MGAGMVRATLAALRTQGPWWVHGKALSGDDVAAVYDLIARGQSLYSIALNVAELERALSILKRHDLIRYDRADKRWVTAARGLGAVVTP